MLSKPSIKKRLIYSALTKLQNKQLLNAIQSRKFGVTKVYTMHTHSTHTHTYIHTDTHTQVPQHFGPTLRTINANRTHPKMASFRKTLSRTERRGDFVASLLANLLICLLNKNT